MPPENYASCNSHERLVYRLEALKPDTQVSEIETPWKVCSMTHRILPRPQSWASPRRAICMAVPAAYGGSRYLSWS
ncbi:hypothetical protein DR64_8111 [Paraburkholderia xenovorans LB400]|nr:hypothetical protein DR64_8111 [Paraburkholderia xenovorans LB400]